MIELPGLPALTWVDPTTGGDATVHGDTLTMRTGASTDWFNDPSGPGRLASAPALAFPTDHDLMLSATVTVAFGATFDAGVLFVHQGPDDWAKWCFERSPQGEHLAVSVVTRGVSDDCNGPAVNGNRLHMRVARIGPVVAFHHRMDHGDRWSLTRLFALRNPEAPTRLGFLSQSPTGAGCTATFTDVSLEHATLRDPRNGS